MCATMAGDGRRPKLARDEGLMVLVCHLSAVRHVMWPELLLLLIYSSSIQSSVAHPGVSLETLPSSCLISSTAGRGSAEIVSWLDLR